VVLNGLGRGQKTGIERWRAFVFRHDLCAFVSDSDGGVASLTQRLLVDRDKYLFQPHDVFLVSP
jgi:hypothetical protein